MSNNLQDPSRWLEELPEPDAFSPEEFHAWRGLIRLREAVMREIDRRLVQETDHAKAVRLMTAAFILTGLRVQKQELASIYDGVRIMHESTAYDMILDEGQLKGEIRLLLRQGRKRLGPADPTTESTLSSIKDLDRLERMAEAMLTVGSWQELLSTP